MRYEQPAPIDQVEGEAALASGSLSRIADALLRASLSDVDPTWVERECIQALAMPDLNVQWAALNALGHLVRRYRTLQIDEVMAAIQPLQSSPALTGKLSDLLDDISMFFAR